VPEDVLEQKAPSGFQFQFQSRIRACASATDAAQNPASFFERAIRQIEERALWKLQASAAISEHLGSVATSVCGVGA
jgi:hypothetical protein